MCLSPFSFVALAVLAALVAGCNQSAPPVSTTTASQSPAPQPTSAAASPEIALSSVDRDGFDALVAGHRGQVVLVDFWATWCVPCVEQFAHTVALARRHAGDGLAAMSVSMDDPSDADSILTFLRSKDAGVVENLVSQDGGPRSMTAFEIAGGALPHYKLYDRAGRLRYTFALDPTADRQFSLQDIDAAVEQLLAE